MSLLSTIGSIGSTIGNVASAIGGLFGSSSQSAPQSPTIYTSGLAGLPASNVFSASNVVRGAGTAVSAVRRALPTVGKVAGAAATAVGVGNLVYDVAGNLIGRGGRKRRRMNPMNARAARRAIRRIKGARKMLQQIERQLPKARTHRTTSARGGARQEFIRQG